MRKTATALLLLFLLAAAAFVATAQAAKPKAGDALPDIQIGAALLPAEAQYLGLTGTAAGARLSQIKADVLLVEIYSMYCPRCQTEAPAINRIFERLAKSPEGAKFKMLGVGAGNSPFEVEFYRKKYQVRMPLLQDADYILHKAFKEVGTPSFFVLKRVPKGGFSIVFFQEGPFEDEDAFYELVVRAAGIKQ